MKSRAVAFLMSIIIGLFSGVIGLFSGVIGGLLLRFPRSHSGEDLGAVSAEWLAEYRQDHES